MTRLLAVLGSLAGFTVTANGYRPLAARGYPSLYAFGFGLFASELPLQLLAGQSFTLAAVSRWLSPRVRRFGWLLSAVSWLGLLGLNHFGRTAKVPLTAALEAGLGTRRRNGSDGVWKNEVWNRPGRPGVDAKVPGVARMLRIYRDYAADADIAYGECGSRNTLDVWRRPDLDRGDRAPVLLQVPGGAWMVGSKRGQAHPLMSHLVELGWVCVSINYRLSPRSTWPDHIVDVKRALAWTKNHISDYGGDPDSYVSTDAPPFLVLHGRNDSLVPVEQSRVFSARLREVSKQPVVYAELPFAQHAFDIFASARARQTAAAVEQFLAEVYDPCRISGDMP
ncbi:MAG: alpha/beta hydrolase [Mycobacterium sp.]